MLFDHLQNPINVGSCVCWNIYPPNAGGHFAEHKRKNPMAYAVVQGFKESKATGELGLSVYEIMGLDTVESRIKYGIMTSGRKQTICKSQILQNPIAVTVVDIEKLPHEKQVSWQLMRKVLDAGANSNAAKLRALFGDKYDA